MNQRILYFLCYFALAFCFSTNDVNAQQNCLKGDCFNGEGILKNKLTNGTPYRYEGYFKEGKFHGQGVFEYKFDDYKLKEYGEFVNGKISMGVREIYFFKEKQKHLISGSFENKELKNGSKKIIFDDGQINVTKIENFKAVNFTSNTLNQYVKEEIIGPTKQIIALKSMNKKLYLELDFTNDIVLTDCIFDTGARGLSLSYQTYTALKKKKLAERLAVDNVEFYGVGGTEDGFFIKIKSMNIGEHTVKNVIANVSTKKDREFTLIGINFFDKFKNVIWNKKQNTLEIYK